jgi:flavin reductase (DIM6/NTAB) family NADH-FMN oxidoreductase RutF
MTATPSNITESEPAEALRLAMRRMAASVSVVTTVDRDGRPHAMTATSVTSLSMEPPALLVCVNQWATIHDPIHAGAPFCVCILGADQQPVAEQCSRGDLKTEEYLCRPPWERDSNGIPYLPGAQACIFCELDQSVPYTTHSIFIGRALSVTRHGDVAPLIYLNSGYRSGV